MDLTRRQWIIAFLIGLATIGAATFGWRAAQIGSTAAFDDRQSISETIKVEQQDIEVTIAAVGDAREYARYLADYAVAAELDIEAAAIASTGDRRLAAFSRAEAQAVRRGATLRAADTGVFGPFSISDDLRSPRASPRPFDFDAHLVALRAEASTALDSPGKLDPQSWATASEDIRDRVRGLVLWAFLMVAAVLLFTVAEVFSARKYFLYVAGGAGIVVVLSAGIGGLSTVFWA